MDRLTSRALRWKNKLKILGEMTHKSSSSETSYEKQFIGLF
jgi:hypothetical protein